MAAGRQFEDIADYITKNQNRFYRLAYTYAGNEQDALDIVQNAICKALQKCDTLRNLNYLSTWFYRILVNESLNFTSRRSREIPCDEDSLPELTYDEPSFNLPEESLYEAVNSLPENVRTILELRFYEEFSLKEIAKITKTNLNTVKARLYRGLEALRTEVSR